jgi:hypothetical protein
MEEYPYNDSFPTWERQVERLERNGGLYGSSFQKWDRYHASEHQLIASGSMMGAHHTTSFGRLRNGSLEHLSKTQIIDGDDSEKLAFTMVKFVLQSSKDNFCEATIIGEVRPVGKNMSNQAAVHKALLLVLNGLKTRY